jgi:thiamine-phosphate pyrophosphorylase
MPARHPAPSLWLMTDERQGDALWTALAALPAGAGIVFRHYHTDPRERRRLFAAVRRVARARRLVLVLAGAARQAAAWRADGVHGRNATRTARPLLRTAPAHDARELIAAGRAGADRIFLSPVFATRSHPGAGALGPVRFGLMAGRSSAVIALGGMDARRAKRLQALGSSGWAAIDALTPDQKRKAVPT